MSTPKEKLNKGQALNAKKKKFFRILQSASNADGRYCSTVSDRLRGELEAKITAVFEAAKQSAKNADSTVQQENSKKSKKELRKLKKKNAAKAVKCPDLIVGMESTLRLIGKKEVAMIWIDSSLASNLVNVIHKLCIVNHIYCLDLDLSPLRTLCNIKSMTMVSFKSTVQLAESPLHDLYQFVVTSVFHISTQTETIKVSSSDIEPAIESKDDKHEPNKQKQSSQSQPQQSSTRFPTDFNFYLTNEADHYSQIMRRRLKPKEDSSTVDEIANQASFIAFSKPKEDYFPAYDCSTRQRFQVKITIEEKESKEQTASSANRLAEKLFDIDKLNSSIESSSSRTTFKSPKLVKGEIVQTPLSTGKRKRANNNDKKGANNNNTKSNKKAKKK